MARDTKKGDILGVVMTIFFLPLLYFALFMKLIKRKDLEDQDYLLLWVPIGFITFVLVSAPGGSLVPYLGRIYTWAWNKNTGNWAMYISGGCIFIATCGTMFTLYQTMKSNKDFARLRFSGLRQFFSSKDKKDKDNRSVASLAFMCHCVNWGLYAITFSLAGLYGDCVQTRGGNTGECLTLAISVPTASIFAIALALALTYTIVKKLPHLVELFRHGQALKGILELALELSLISFVCGWFIIFFVLTLVLTLLPSWGGKSYGQRPPVLLINETQAAYNGRTRLEKGLIAAPELFFGKNVPILPMLSAIMLSFLPCFAYGIFNFIATYEAGGYHIYCHACKKDVSLGGKVATIAITPEERSWKAEMSSPDTSKHKRKELGSKLASSIATRRARESKDIAVATRRLKAIGNTLAKHGRTSKDVEVLKLADKCYEKSRELALTLHTVGDAGAEEHNERTLILIGTDPITFAGDQQTGGTHGQGIALGTGDFVISKVARCTGGEDDHASPEDHKGGPVRITEAHFDGTNTTCNGNISANVGSRIYFDGYEDPDAVEVKEGSMLFPRMFMLATIIVGLIVAAIGIGIAIAVAVARFNSKTKDEKGPKLDPVQVLWEPFIIIGFGLLTIGFITRIVIECRAQEWKETIKDFSIRGKGGKKIITEEDMHKIERNRSRATNFVAWFCCSDVRPIRVPQKWVSIVGVIFVFGIFTMLAEQLLLAYVSKDIPPDLAVYAGIIIALDDFKVILQMWIPKRFKLLHWCTTGFVTLAQVGFFPLMQFAGRLPPREAKYTAWPDWIESSQFVTPGSLPGIRPGDPRVDLLQAPVYAACEPLMARGDQPSGTMCGANGTESCYFNIESQTRPRCPYNTNAPNDRNGWRIFGPDAVGPNNSTASLWGVYDPNGEPVLCTMSGFKGGMGLPSFETAYAGECTVSFLEPYPYFFPILIITEIFSELVAFVIDNTVAPGDGGKWLPTDLMNDGSEAMAMTIQGLYLSAFFFLPGFIKEGYALAFWQTNWMLAIYTTFVQLTYTIKNNLFIRHLFVRVLNLICCCSVSRRLANRCKLFNRTHAAGKALIITFIRTFLESLCQSAGKMALIVPIFCSCCLYEDQKREHWFPKSSVTPSYFMVSNVAVKAIAARNEARNEEYKEKEGIPGKICPYIGLVKLGCDMVCENAFPYDDDGDSEFVSTEKFLSQRGADGGYKHMMNGGSAHMMTIAAMTTLTSAFRLCLGLIVSLTLVPSILVLLISFDMPMTKDLRTSYNFERPASMTPYITYYDSLKSDTLPYWMLPGYMARWNQPLLWNGAFYNETTLCNANCYCSPVAPKTAYHTAIALKSCLNACQITTRTSMAGKGNPTSYPTRVSSYPTSAPTAFPTAYYPTNYPTAFPTNYPIASSTSPTDQPTKWDSTSDEENPDSNYACSFHLGPQPEGRCCDKEGMTIIPRIDRYNAWHEPLRWDAFDAEDASANFFIILLASFMVLTCGVGPHIIADLIAKCCTWDRVKTLSEWTPGSISSNDLIYTKAQFRLERKVWDLSLDPLESLVDDHIDAEELSLLYDVEEQRSLGLEAIQAAHDMRVNALQILPDVLKHQLLAELGGKSLLKRMKSKSFDLLDDGYSVQQALDHSD